MQCKASLRDTIVLPCNHNTICGKCGPTTSKCPLCNAEVKSFKQRVQSHEEAEQMLASMAKNEPKATRVQPAQMTEAQLRRFRLEEVFMHFDEDNSGTIDKMELKAFMKKFIYQGLDLSDEELNGAVDIVDVNKVSVCTCKCFGG